tara:strand:- start:76 stop:477 length:402 start_codon:yes stop_codon:yes gene_type:complete
MFPYQDLPDISDNEIHGDSTAANDQQPSSQSSYPSKSANPVGAEALPEWSSKVEQIVESLDKALDGTRSVLQDLKGQVQDLRDIAREVFGTTQGALMANGHLKRKGDSGNVKDLRDDTGRSQKKARTSGRFHL